MIQLQLIHRYLPIFFPASAYIGDTLTFTGENPDTNINALTIGFGGITATVISATKTTIKAIVPDET